MMNSYELMALSEKYEEKMNKTKWIFYTGFTFLFGIPIVPGLFFLLIYGIFDFQWANTVTGYCLACFPIGILILLPWSFCMIPLQNKRDKYRRLAFDQWGSNEEEY
jgi:hypothetical protein